MGLCGSNGSFWKALFWLALRPPTVRFGMKHLLGWLLPLFYSAGHLDGIRTTRSHPVAGG